MTSSSTKVIHRAKPRQVAGRCVGGGREMERPTKLALAVSYCFSGGACLRSNAGKSNQGRAFRMSLICTRTLRSCSSMLSLA